MTAMLEQIRFGWNRRRRSTDPVNLLYPFEVDRIHVVRSRPRHPDAHAGPITQMHLFFSRLFAPRARAPEGEIIYAIGDIHGRDDLLGRLHDAIGRALTAAAGARQATVVYLGDSLARPPTGTADPHPRHAHPVTAATP